MVGSDQSDGTILSLKQRVMYANDLGYILLILSGVLGALWVFVAGWFYSESGTDETIAEMSNTETVFGIDPIPFLAGHAIVIIVVAYVGYWLFRYSADELAEAKES